MRTDCRICHGTNLELRLQLAPTPIGDEFLITPQHQPLHPIDLYQCKDCGLAQLLYEIPPEEIYKDYIYLTGSSVGLQQHFTQYAREALKVAHVGRGELVVDIGSNDGTLLREFQKLGANVLGFEPCEKIATAAWHNGIPTIQAYFAKGHVKVAKAKLITANNVVANMNDLDSFMEAVVDLLADDGTFVFESFYLGDVVKNMVFDFIYHEHLSAFSIRPVKHLLARYGMQLYRVDHQPTKGGSIRYYCNRYYGKRAKPLDYDYGGADPELDPVSDYEEDYLYEKRTWTAFERRIAVEREKVREFCSKAKAEGKVIAGFGACISGTTLLYHFGLHEYLAFIVDDNVAKQKRFSPGHHLPVWDTGVLNTYKPDYVIALAWRFADDFQAAHPDIKMIPPTAMLLDLVTPLHSKTKRDYMARLMDDKIHCMKRAREFERDYWDGDRRYGYGGYKNDGRWKPIAQKLIDHYDLQPGMKVLDIGCGKGFLLHELQKLMPELLLCGVERSLYALNNMPQDLRGAFQYARVEQSTLPYEDQSIDLVLSLGCLHNLTLSELFFTLPEIARVGRQGYIWVESFRNEEEWFNLCAWCLTAESLMRPEDWCFIYDKCGYKGDYEFIFFD